MPGGMGGMGVPGRGGPEDMDIDLEDLLGGIGGGGNRGGFKFSNQGGQKPRKQAKVQDDTIEKEIFVSIEEIATGCEKKMKISRKVMRQDGTRTMEDKVLKIVVKPGWKAGTKVTFAKEDDGGQGVEDSCEARVEGWDEGDLCEGGRPGGQQDPRGHRLHHQGQAAPLVHTRRSEPKVHLQDPSPRVVVRNRGPSPNVRG